MVHRHDPKLLQTYSQLLASRGVEGIITIDTSIVDEPAVPTVAVAGHQKIENVTNIILDHRRAAEVGLRHLKELGHERIAFLRGQSKSPDSAIRWEAIQIGHSVLGCTPTPHCDYHKLTKHNVESLQRTRYYLGWANIPNPCDRRRGASSSAIIRAAAADRALVQNGHSRPARPTCRECCHELTRYWNRLRRSKD